MKKRPTGDRHEVSGRPSWLPRIEAGPAYSTGRPSTCYPVAPPLLALCTAGKVMKFAEFKPT